MITLILMLVILVGVALIPLLVPSIEETQARAAKELRAAERRSNYTRRV